ncbi:MAG: hypothetical protein V9E81_08890 [Marmoricola sp.]
MRWIVEFTPLYRAVVICRELTTGILTWGSAWSVVYFVVVGYFGVNVIGRRLAKLLLH